MGVFWGLHGAAIKCGSYKRCEQRYFRRVCAKQRRRAPRRGGWSELIDKRTSREGGEDGGWT